MTTPRKRPEERLKMGRPTVVTPEVLAKLEQAFGMGCSDKEACLYAGISMDALYNYQNRRPDFAEWKALLKEKPVLKARNTVVTSLNDPEHAKWYLERKARSEFGREKEITVQTFNNFDPKEISDIQAELNGISDENKPDAV